MNLIAHAMGHEDVFSNVFSRINFPRSFTTHRPTSGASSFNFGVDRLEFATCNIDPHLPVDSSLFCIHAARPRGDFARQEFDTADAAAVYSLTSNTA